MITFADLFAGGGGTTTGALNVPGIHVSWALNHDPVAIAMHAAAHPETKHYQADIRTQNVAELDPVNILWASLECTEHSKAKGGKSKDIGSFTLGWELYRYLDHCQPDVLMIENVTEFVRWGELKNGKRVKAKEGIEYRKWVEKIRSMGWVNYQYRFLNAADYGAPTRRIRYFGIFTKPGVEIKFPEQTHHQDPNNISGLPVWKPCRDYIDLHDEGNSVFGREFNPNVPKGKRKPLSPNTLRRIAGGIKKFAPEMHFIMKYYGNGINCQSLNEPLHTIRTHDSHALISLEKRQFIQDYCHMDYQDSIEEPLRTQLTRQTKQLITLKANFISQYYGNSDSNNSHHRCHSVDNPCMTITTANRNLLMTVKANFIAKYFNGKRKNGNVQHHCEAVNKPFPTITTVNRNVLMTAEAQFISAQYNSNGKPEANNHSIEMPLSTITTEEKFQFITAYFNSSNRPETQNQSIDAPLNTILTGTNKKALVTAMNNGLVDFDIKMRFLNEDELASIMGFPPGYFKKGKKLSKKAIIRMIGNAVHVTMAELLVREMYQTVNNLKQAV